uniref:Serine racemase n=1 Tax=Timema monikensis TaxID=170555 RepID=A0A7R9EF55_9NEOP|nr:unnamed protein product [Timema monikensis]
MSKSAGRRSAVARQRTSDLTVMPRQVVYERADLLFEYRVIAELVCCLCGGIAVSSVIVSLGSEYSASRMVKWERGARYALLMLSDEKKKKGVISASLGNHALALCYHGKDLKIPVTVVMPIVAPIMKIQSCRQHGASVVVQGDDMGEAKRIAMQLAKERELTYINGYDHPHIMAGQGTLGLEIVEQVPNIDAVVVPVGGGGLIAGVALAIMQKKTISITVTRVIFDHSPRTRCSDPNGEEKPLTIQSGRVLLPVVQGRETAHFQSHLVCDTYSSFEPVEFQIFLRKNEVQCKQGTSFSLRTKVVAENMGVESERCASFSKAVKAGMPVYTKIESTLADGLAVPMVGYNAFATAAPLIDKLASETSFCVGCPAVQFHQCVLDLNACADKTLCLHWEDLVLTFSGRGFCLCVWSLFPILCSANYGPHP